MTDLPEGWEPCTPPPCPPEEVEDESETEDIVLQVHDSYIGHD